MPKSDPRLEFSDLDEFVELAPGAAEIIGQCGANLYLRGLHSITAEDVRALNRKPWHWNGYNLQANDLDLSGLEAISLEVAEALAERFSKLPDGLSPGDLVLNGLQSLPADVAAALARFQGEIKLDGLLSLDAEAAKALAAHRGNLSLDGLSSLTEEMAEAILGAPYQAAAKDEDDDEEEDDDDEEEKGHVSLWGLEELSPAVASRFVARFRGKWIKLPRLKALDAETARALSQHDSDLDFEGITQLDAETASALSMCKGDLSLGGLASLQTDVAAALAKHEGNLSLNSIASLDDESAEALGRHHGHLSLAGLCTLSEAGARYLANHDGELKVDVSSLPDEVREILMEHPSLFQIEVDEPARLTGRMRATLRDAGIATVCARYDGSGDDGGFESFAITLRDGNVLGVEAYSLDADDVAEAIRDAETDAKCSEEQAQAAAKLIRQLVWSGIPRGWEIDSGSFGEVTIDCEDGTITVSHTWRENDDEESDSTGDDDVDEDDEDIEDSTDDEDFEDGDDADEEDEEDEESPAADSSGAQVPREDDEVLATDVAELSDILRRGAPRKDWLNAHADHLSIWERAAERGTAPGLLIVGLCHWFGVAYDMDHSIAKEYFEKAAILGEPQAQFSLGQAFQFLAHEESEETSESQALADGYRADAYRWYLESAKSGLSLAQMKVGEALWSGAGVDEDERAAIPWIRAAAEQGNREAAFMLAELLVTNRPSAGITRDRAQALEWGRQAAANGHEEAADWVRSQERFARIEEVHNVLTVEMAQEIFENWKQKQISEDESDNEAPPTPAGPFEDPQGTVTNSVGMKLVPIPAGEFLMGSSEECSPGDTSEQFQHPVRITKPFFMGMHPVTQAQYERVTGENPSHFKGDNLPVEHLWWKDAQRFCELLSALPEEQQAGRRYRLPTEAEWEYACRAGTTTPFNTGDSLEPHQARFASNSSRTTPKQTAPVGTYPPNAWGLFDVHGNVWEWTNDWFSSDYFEESPVDDPQGPESGTHHTLRGGSASVEAEECYSALRGEAGADGPEPGNSHERFAFYGDFGVRVVCETA